MRENPVKRKLAAGGLAVGTMVFEFSTSGIARIAAAAGAEFVLFDMEHTGWSTETVRGLFATCGGAGIVPLVRVPATEYHFVARVLDVGAMGVMVPMVESAEQARRIAAFAKYPPVGRRGAGFGLAHDGYAPGDVREKMASANREVLLIAQIETAVGLENVEQIAAVEGIDVLWVGQFDLTNSMGIPGDFSCRQFNDALARIVAATRERGKAAGYMVSSEAEAKARLSEGFRCLSFGGDLWIYQQALRDGLHMLRRVAESTR
jgi:2-dehydro-3-deoxyglucarate aldolase/4-hydroxy-2-oxoheptanedioate aldolase